MATAEGVDTTITGLTVINDPSNQVQEAVEEVVSNLLDSGFMVEGLADKVAEKIGLSQSSSSMQTAAYVLTKVAILGAAELVGVGTTLVKVDTTGFTLAQIKKGIEDIKESLNIVLGAPLQLALEAYWNSINQLENHQIQRSVEEARKMQDHGRQAYVYIKGKPSLKSLKDATVATNLCMLAEVMLTSYDGDKIVPFYLLSEDKKRVIVSSMTREIKKLEDFKDKINKDSWFPTSKKKNNKQQDELDQVLKRAYPFLSEGLGATSSLTVIKQAPVTIRMLVKYLPDGVEDKAKVVIGREEGKPRAVFLWKKDGEVWLETWQGTKINYIPAITEELQVSVPWPRSAAEGVVISGGDSNLGGQYWRVHTEEGRDVVYQRADTTLGEKWYLYRAGKERRWWLGREVGSEEVKRDAVRSSGGNTSSLPPSSGWEWRYKEEWRSYGDVSVVQGEAEPCGQITLKGETSKYTCYSGTYTPVKGDWRRGYQVFTSSSGFYLYARREDFGWGWYVGKMEGPGKLELCELVTVAWNPCPALSMRSGNGRWSVQCTSHPAK